MPTVRPSPGVLGLFPALGRRRSCWRGVWLLCGRLWWYGLRGWGVACLCCPCCCCLCGLSQRALQCLPQARALRPLRFKVSLQLPYFVLLAPRLRPLAEGGIGLPGPLARWRPHSPGCIPPWGVAPPVATGTGTPEGVGGLGRFPPTDPSGSRRVQGGGAGVPTGALHPRTHQEGNVFLV